MLSTRPEKSVGTDDIWDLATEGLKGALKRKGWDYTVRLGWVWLGWGFLKRYLGGSRGTLRSKGWEHMGGDHLQESEVCFSPEDTVAIERKLRALKKLVKSVGSKRGRESCIIHARHHPKGFSKFAAVCSCTHVRVD